MNESSKVESTDPVCGMTVNIERAEAAGLATDHAGTRYHFCGRGCLLEFRDDPDRFLKPTYDPSM